MTITEINKLINNANEKARHATGNYYLLFVESITPILD